MNESGRDEWAALGESSEHSGESARGTRIIGRILPGAVRLWLRSQVDQIESLSLELKGRDRQILSGYLPGVAVAAQQAIYRGIHIDKLTLSAAEIRINIAQVIRGKPLRLLKQFPVMGEVALTGQDLNASLVSPLLREGLLDFWRKLMQVPLLAEAVATRYGPLPLALDVELYDAQVRLGHQCLGLSFYPKAQNQIAERPVILGTGLALVGGNQLRLDDPRWLDQLDQLSDPQQGQLVEGLHGFHWDLGRDAQLETLALQPELLCCKGQIWVRP